MTKNLVVAKAVVFNDRGHVLVLRRSETHPTHAHHTDLPGGIVDEGESERDAAVRELVEETGITVNPDDCKLLYADTEYYEHHGHSVARMLYQVHLNHTPDVTMSYEHEAYDWCTIADLLDRDDIVPFYHTAIEYGVKHSLIFT